MGWRLRRSIRITKGLRLNINKGGLGLSAGVKGLHVGIGPRGLYTSAGIPGTGLYTMQYLGGTKGREPSPVGSGSTTSVLPGTSAIGCGVLVALLGITLVWGLPVLGATAIAIGLLAIFTGVNNPARVETKRTNAALSKISTAIELGRQKRYEESLGLLEEAKTISPDSPRVHYLAGIVYGEAERYQEALESLELAQRLECTEPSIPILLAACFGRTGHPEKGIQILQDIPDTHELHIPACITLAEIFAAAGQYSLAVETLKKTPLRKQKLDETLLLAHYHLALYQLKLGDKKSALRHFRRIYAHDAEYRDVREQLQKIGGLP